MDYRRKLFCQKQVYNHKDTDGLFFQAVRESVAWHGARCPEYKLLLERAGFHAEDFNRYDDLWKLPPVPTLYLKKHELRSMPGNKIHFRSTTSGTSGHPVTVGFDAGAMLLGANMLRKMLLTHRMLSIVPHGYVILGYQPGRRNRMGAARTAYGSTFLTPAVGKVYALKDTGSDYELNMEGVLAALEGFAEKGTPVRINGFPAYLYFLLQRLRAENIRLRLNPRSQIFLGGGWKRFSSEKVEKAGLYSMAEEFLGVPEERFLEFFGVVEHNIPYFDCKNHHFHVPVYGRVIVRDVQTLEPLPAGEPGLLNLITPLLRSMPLTSIITDDLAVLHEGRGCGCGIKTPYFEVLGRAGVRGIRTCANLSGGFLEGGI